VPALKPDSHLRQPGSLQEYRELCSTELHLHLGLAEASAQWRVAQDFRARRRDRLSRSPVRRAMP